jgi:hypothetical protein
MRHAGLILAVIAVATALAPAAAAETTYTEQPALTHAASVVPGQVTETGEPGPARVFCWNAEAWSAAGWDGVADGVYDGFNELPSTLCRPMLRAVAGWQPRRPDRRWRLGYAAFILGHEAAHAAGADHSNTDGTPSADCVAASHIRLILRRLGQTRWQARRIERELIGTGLGAEPAETERCWQPL